jgi:dGTPase
MHDFGGFEHNLQSLRVVDELEERYASFRGLNLTFETREGILKHCSIKNARVLGDVGVRFLTRRQPGLEAQLANLADEIAYNNHDVDDGLRSGLITLEQLRELPFFAEHMRWVEQRHSGLKAQRLGSETVRRMISHLVSGLIESSAASIAETAPRDSDAVRSLAQPLIRFPLDLHEAQHALKKFLRAELYAHPHVRMMTEQAQETVRWLFEMLSADYELMPEEHARRARDAAESGDAAAAARVVADYIAGMTDRFALQTRDALRARL